MFYDGFKIIQGVGRIHFFGVLGLVAGYVQLAASRSCVYSFHFSYVWLFCDMWTIAR